MANIELPKNSITAGNAEKHEKKFEKVTTGKVTTKEKNDIQKAASLFIAEDLKTVRDHVIKDIMIPQVKNIILDLVWSTLSGVLNGDVRPRGTSGTNYAQPSRVSYNSYSNRNNAPRPAVASPINYQDQFETFTAPPLLPNVCENFAANIFLACLTVCHNTFRS